MNSSGLAIYLVNLEVPSSIKRFSIMEFRRKAVAIPYLEKIVVVPCLHFFLNWIFSFFFVKEVFSP